MSASSIGSNISKFRLAALYVIVEPVTVPSSCSLSPTGFSHFHLSLSLRCCVCLSVHLWGPSRTVQVCSCHAGNRMMFSILWFSLNSLWGGIETGKKVKRQNSPGALKWSCLFCILWSGLNCRQTQIYKRWF